MKTTKIILITALAFGAICTAVSCRKVTNPIGKQDGYKPIYKSAQEAFDIKMMPAQPYTNPGKINQYGNYTLQMDNDKGVHIIDCSNPSNPKKIGFIKVPGCSELAIQNDILYLDNYSDLISIKLDAMQNAVVEQRVKNVFVLANEQAPPFANKYFECVDASKGPVIKWVEATLENPNCKTF
jgi:LVIVD repeat